MKQTFICLFLVFAMGAAFADEEERHVKPFWVGNPVIEVLGRAEAKVRPNRATFIVKFVEKDETAVQATREAVERGRVAYETIKMLSGDAATVTTSTTVDPYYKIYKNKDGEYWQHDTPDKIDGYTAVVELNIDVQSLEVLDSVRSAAIALGPEFVGSVDFNSENAIEDVEAVFQAAVKNAATRANVIAEETGQELRRLLYLQEGRGHCLSQIDWDSRGYDLSAKKERLSTIVLTAQMKESLSVSEEELIAMSLPSDIPDVTISANVCAIYEVNPRPS